MHFQLMILMNKGTKDQYPYVAVAAGCERVINISAEKVEIIKKEESIYFEEDYLPTSRFADVDMAGIDQLVNAYIGPFEYRILVHFNEHKHMVLTYHSPTNEAPKDYDIFDGYPEARARKLVEVLYPIFEGIKEQAELLER